MTSQGQQGNSHKILIVNDNATELASLIAGLKLNGFSISGTTDAFSCLDVLARSHFDVVLIDLMIPDFNGLALARKIRDQFPAVRTMLMSDYLLSPVQLAKADTGAIGFVPKPCNYEDLATFIKSKLEAQTYEDGKDNTTLRPDIPVDVLAIKYSY